MHSSTVRTEGYAKLYRYHIFTLASFSKQNIIIGELPQKTGTQRRKFWDSLKYYLHNSYRGLGMQTTWWLLCVLVDDAVQKRCRLIGHHVVINTEVSAITVTIDYTVTEHSCWLTIAIGQLRSNVCDDVSFISMHRLLDGFRGAGS